MIELCVIALRAVQYAAVAVALGLPAFLIYSPAVRGLSPAWPRGAVLAAALVLLVAAPAVFVAQTAMMAGSLEAALNRDALSAVLGLPLGAALVARAAGAALLILVLALSKPGHALWLSAMLIAAFVNATFAWTGHAGATGDLFHLASDILHLLAASIWIGALIAFAGLLFLGPRADYALVSALAGFARVGTLAVALLIATGLVNGLVLVGLDNIPTLGQSPYGLVLIAKLILFAVMLMLAGANRFRFTPALTAAGEGATDAPLWALRVSVGAELAAGLILLALVAILGTLPPPTGV